MKVVTSMLIILPLVAGIVAPANAFDARSFFDQLDRQSGGTSGAGG